MSDIRSKDLHHLAGLRDPVGVLTIYVTVDPSTRPAHLPLDPAGPAPTGSGHHRAAALRRRLDALEPALNRLLDPAAPGRGRALFTGLDGDDVRTFAVPAGLGDAVHVGESAVLGPLAAAFSAGAPAGIVAVSGHGVRVVDLRFGHARVVAALAYRPAPQPHELVGPGQAGVRPGPRSAAQRDLYDRRATAHLQRFLTESAVRLSRLAPRADWELTLVTGDPELTAAFAAGLPRPARAGVVTAEHVAAGGLPADRIAHLVEADLRAGRQRARRRLAEQVRDAAHAGDAATYGLPDTARAAGIGRIRHLLLDGSRSWADGSGAGERLILQAYRAGAEVTVLDAEAAEPLAGGDGVAALLHV